MQWCVCKTNKTKKKGNKKNAMVLGKQKITGRPCIIINIINQIGTAAGYIPLINKPNSSEQQQDILMTNILIANIIT
jgi:hypothetical protein